MIHNQLITFENSFQVLINQHRYQKKKKFFSVLESEIPTKKVSFKFSLMIFN